jgi:hypothetical protein
MKVLDLKCAHQHVFEGWFASEDDFQTQLARGLVQCPMCGDAAVSKQLSAPRLNLGAAPPALKAAPAQSSDAAASATGRELSISAPQAPGQALTAPDKQTMQDMQSDWMKMVRQVMANTEDVGSNFAEVARQMHYGETEERSIRGQTSPQEAIALLEEGITVMPLPIPAALKEPLQ